jgi:zona occludens toxin (predicted ATPase)
MPLATHRPFLYSQARKHRHFGMDAEILAMDGNAPVLQLFD